MQEEYTDLDGYPVTPDQMECGVQYRDSAGDLVGLNAQWCEENGSSFTSQTEVPADVASSAQPAGEMMDAVLGTLIVIGVIAVLVVLLLNAVYIVRTNEVAVIERFGRFKRIAKAGINVKVPIVDRIANRLSLRIKAMDQVVSTITSDKVSVGLVISVQYRVSTAQPADPQSAPHGQDQGLYLANYALTNVHDQISAYVSDAVRSTIPVKKLDDVFAEKEDIANAVRERLEQHMSAYGYEIVNTLVTEITPNSEVEKAMNEISAADRLKEAATSKAEAYKIEIVGRAEGDSKAKELSGVGIAAQRKAIADGLAEQHKVLKEAGVPNAELVMLANQYFDTSLGMAEKGSATTVFMPGGAGGAGSISQQIQEAILVAGSASTEQAG